MGGLEPLSLWKTTAMLEAEFAQDIAEMRSIEAASHCGLERWLVLAGLRGVPRDNRLMR